MKRLFVLFSLGFAFFVTGNVFASNIRVAVVDVHSILQTSPKVKLITKQLKKQFTARKGGLLKLQAKLQADIANYTKNKAILSSSKAQKLQTKITSEGQALRAKQAAFQQDLYTAQNKQMGFFLAGLKKVIKKIAAKQGFILVLPKDSVLYSAGNSDITSQVEKALK